MKKSIKEKGITLVALVVTIIILLILAGVTIGSIVGNNGLFTRTKQAVEKYKESQEKEKNALTDIESYIDESVSKEIKNIEIKSDISYNSTFSEAQITYTIKYDGIIKELSINEENVIIPEKIEEKYVVETKTNENGIYKIKLINDKKDYKTNEAIVTELVSNLEIHNVDELLAFRDKVNKGGTYEGKIVKLMENLNLSNVCGEEKGDLIPIGSEEKPFLGTFEGNNKTISKIYANNENYQQGFFCNIGSKGTVKNLTIEGNMVMGGNSGGLVGRNDGIIESCISNVEIHSSGWRNGGIAGSNYGKIYKSMNIGNIESGDSAGGIAGLNGGIISSCFNKGNVNSKRWSSGGITALNGYSATHNPSFKAKGKIYNCYNIGQITSPDDNWFGGIVGANGYELEDAESYIYNSYSINTESIYGLNYNEENIINYYTTEANTKVKELNDGIDESGKNDEQPWVEDTEGINGGYPILNWQKNN